MNLAIVTSCAGYAQYLPEWADSILSLTRTPALVAVFTHGSTVDRNAGAAAVARLTDAGIRARHEHEAARLPLGAARNRAVAMSDTEWVMHFDADDLLMPHALDDIAQLAPQADVVCLGYERSGNLAAGPRQRSKLYRTSIGQEALANPTPCSGVSPFRRSFWERAPYRTNLTGGWDTALWLDFAHLGARFIPTRRPCFWYRQHADSVFNTRRKDVAATAFAGARFNAIRRGDTGVSVVVPRAKDHGHRDRLWDWLRPRYAALHPTWQVVEGFAPSRPWRKGAAVRDALARASGEILVIIDADCILPPATLVEAIDRVQAGAPWVIPHGSVYRLAEDVTERVLTLAPENRAAEDIVGPLARPAYRGLPGGGCLVLPRTTYDATGGFPLAFEGWGSEDEGFAVILDTLAGPHVRLNAPLIHLWHPPADGRQDAPGKHKNRALLMRLRQAKGHPELMWHIAHGLNSTVSLGRPRGIMLSGIRQAAGARHG
jgi:glycosyltransferase involved in cell wall biosynthesis